MTQRRYGGYDDIAFWISPWGTVHRVVTHGLFIWDHPGMFGETEESLRDLYAEHRERFRTDRGAARERIVAKAVRDGWVRIRRYPNGWGYDCNHTAESLSRLASFLATIRTNGLHGYREDRGDTPLFREGGDDETMVDVYTAAHRLRVPLHAGCGVRWSPKEAAPQHETVNG